MNDGDKRGTKGPPGDEASRRQLLGCIALVIGAVAGFVILSIVYVVIGGSAGMGSVSFRPVGPSAFVPIVLYFLLASILAVAPRSRGPGTGLLLGGGFWLLFGGGPCLGTLSTGSL